MTRFNWWISKGRSSCSNTCVHTHVRVCVDLVIKCEYHFSRAQNKISTAIECTWELTSAELQYHWAKEEASLAEHDKQLRIIYAMALTR